MPQVTNSQNEREREGVVRISTKYRIDAQVRRQKKILKRTQRIGEKGEEKRKSEQTNQIKEQEKKTKCTQFKDVNFTL